MSPRSPLKHLALLLLALSLACGDASSSGNGTRDGDGDFDEDTSNGSVGPDGGGQGRDDGLDGSDGPGNGNTDGGPGGAQGPDGGDPDEEIPAGPTEFFTSFEDGEPQPTWINTAEVLEDGSEKVAGIAGRPAWEIAGSLFDRIVQVRANDENAPNETAAHGADGDVTTKWLIFAPNGTLTLTLDEPAVVRRYAITSANDAPERDPRNWTFEGSNDGQTWTTLDTRSDQLFATRFDTRVFEVDNGTAYRHYRLHVTSVQGGNILQLAELQLSDGDGPLPAVSAMKTFVGKGPGASYNAKIGAGFTGTHALRFAGSTLGAGRAYSYNKVFEVDLYVTRTSELSYVIFADEVANDREYASTYAAVDLLFDDGTYLSELDALDQQFATASPAGQGASRTLLAGEWNHKVVNLGAVAHGKTIKRILVGYDRTSNARSDFGGWVDDIRISKGPEHPAPTRPSDYVITTRGTNSSGGYSRGNNFPATAVPHGFNFWTPVTDAGSNSWIYTYHRNNDDDNLPRLQALSMSHQPSPWMGDRQSFQVMPSSSAGAPDINRGRRALPFRHTNEIARPHYYSVQFENGIRAEIAPTDHAALFRFTFPDDNASLIFDNVNNEGGLTLDAQRGVLRGYSDARSGLSAGATRIFVYATFDKPVVQSGMLSGGGGANVGGYFRFAVSPADRTVTMRIASSLISVDQAQKNLALEITPSDTLETVRERAQALWDEKLGIVEVEGANFDQLTTLYSNLYRLFLYPNSGFENVGTNESPVYKYASPVSSPTGSNTELRTGARILDGKIYVNNGFWDTYRATWPALALLTPEKAGEMIEGFVQQYRDGGWISRWSSPGYADLMTGTSSDVAFADAFLKGVTNFNVEDAYDAALRNAMVVPPNGAVGRKGQQRSPFLGYVSTETGAGLSWAMAGYLNDFGIANMARALAEDTSHPRRREFAESAEYFLERSRNYVHLFDPAIGFFQGRAANGAFRVSPNDFDPRNWGHDYTETNAWNMAFDAPHDGQGLANLYGGKAALAAKLDEFFATPETASFPGGYGGVIHEMREARDVRMGQLGLSNQPSYHIPYMYNYAGQPAKTQAKVREALTRLFGGSAIGQGYLGDEDNGAASAWWLFGALGFYPLQVGSPYYTIGSPLFTKATIKLENGKTLTISAPNNNHRRVYVQSLKVNGQLYHKTYISHDVLASGATLEFEMGEEPSTWGTAADAAPPSITTGSEAPAPLRDITKGATNMPVNALFDDTSDTRMTLSGANPSIEFTFDRAERVTFYTLTSSNAGARPTGVRLSGSINGTNWYVLDTRSAVGFRWNLETRAFKVNSPGNYTRYRLDFEGPDGTALAEVELLAHSD